MWRFKTNNKITTLINYTYRNNSHIISAIFLPSNVLEFAGLYIYILKWSTFSPKFPTIMKWVFLYMWRFKTPLVMSHKGYASVRHVSYALKPNCKYVMTICFLFSLLYRAIEQDIEDIRPTICTRVFCSKIFTTLKLFYTH
jgi:hypothetical protein